jgi:MFS family permease
VAGFACGAGGGTFQTIWVTLLHELTPAEKRGRVASIDLLGRSACSHWVFFGAGLLNLALYTFLLFLPGIREVN